MDYGEELEESLKREKLLGARLAEAENKMSKYSEEETLLSYEGRKISDRESLKSGYCGSCSIEIHRNQVNDPESWVHSSMASWIRKRKPEPSITKLQAELAKAYRVIARKNKVAERVIKEKRQLGIENEKLRDELGLGGCQTSR